MQYVRLAKEIVHGLKSACSKDESRRALCHVHTKGDRITATDGHHDGIPVAMMEAMASGVPVISSGISGIPELVEDGVNGILLPEKDAVAVADAIKTLLTDRDMRRRFSAEARRMVVERFEIRDVAGRLKELFVNYSKVKR